MLSVKCFGSEISFLAGAVHVDDVCRLRGRVGVARGDFCTVERFVVLDGTDVGDVHQVAQRAVAVLGGIAEMGLGIAEAVASDRLEEKVFEAGDFVGVRLAVVAKPTEENDRMTAGGRGAVAQEIAGARFVKIRDLAAETVAGDGAGLGIALFLDIPGTGAR